MEWASEEYTVKNFEDTLKGAYADDFYNISLKAVHHSRITFICAIPFWMEEKFIKMTEEAADFILSQGVVSIEINGTIILKKEHHPGK